MVAGYHFSGCVLHGTTLLPQEPWGIAAPIQYAIGRLAVWLLPGHLAVFGFFLMLGAVKPSTAGVATMIVAALGALYAAHAWWVARHTAGRDPREVRARERRGF